MCGKMESHLFAEDRRLCQYIHFEILCYIHTQTVAEVYVRHFFLFFKKAQLMHFLKKAQLTNAVILAYNPYAQLTTGLQEYAYQHALNAKMLSFTSS